MYENQAAKLSQSLAYLVFSRFLTPPPPPRVQVRLSFRCLSSFFPFLLFTLFKSLGLKRSRRVTLCEKEFPLIFYSKEKSESCRGNKCVLRFSRDALVKIKFSSLSKLISSKQEDVADIYLFLCILFADF